MTTNGDVEAKKLGEKLLLDVEVEGLSSVGWNHNDVCAGVNQLSRYLALFVLWTRKGKCSLSTVLTTVSSLACILSLTDGSLLRSSKLTSPPADIPKQALAKLSLESRNSMPWYQTRRQQYSSWCHHNPHTTHQEPAKPHCYTLS